MHIAILLGTYNGGYYLQEQLNSFEKQSYSDWSLWASDDGSSDDTVKIIRGFAKKIGNERVHLINGPKRGFAANFLSLVRNPDIEADGYAYSDQDDIWISDKLELATQFLASVSNGIPALYCSRTLYVNKNNRALKKSKLFSRPAIFSNALVQNIASGNTMVFNSAARDLFAQLDVNINVELHDWLTYILISGAGGQVYFDAKPSVRYRQHGQNIIGMNSGFKASLYRLYMLLYKGRYRTWNDLHIQALSNIEGLLTPHNKLIFDGFVKARQLKSFAKVAALKRVGVFRQTLFGNLGFYLAALMNKV